MSNLDSIRVLYRTADSLALYGIPYDMRSGQSPRDLWRARESYVEPRPGHYGSRRVNLYDWIYLGSPGWYGDMPRERIERIKAYLVSVAEYVPHGPHEWSTVPR